MGLNMRLARHFKRMSQLNLAELTGITQKTISRMEREKVITHEENLAKVAAVLGVEVEFIKTFQIPEMGKIVISENNTQTNTGAENSQETFMQNGLYEVQEQNNNYNCSVEDLKEIFKLVLEEKDKMIAYLEKENQELRSRK